MRFWTEAASFRANENKGREVIELHRALDLV